MGKKPNLTIEFYGICSQFRRTVPGVPHRAVLPDTTMWYPGSLMAPDLKEPVLYLLPPHFSYVFGRDGDVIELIDAPGIELGWIVRGVRLQIINAIDESLQYDPDYDIPQVNHYAWQYRYSDSVVLGGRASCYFDVFRGTVTHTLNGEAMHTVVTMTTDGPPILQVTLLAAYNDPYAVMVKDVPLRSAELVVGNSSLSCADARFDFLWHLLTDQAGIPAHMPRLPPGFDTPPECDDKSAQDAFSTVIDLGLPARPNVSPDKVAFTDTSASCSNSQYP